VGVLFSRNQIGSTSGIRDQLGTKIEGDIQIVSRLVKNTHEGRTMMVRKIRQPRGFSDWRLFLIRQCHLEFGISKLLVFSLVNQSIFLFAFYLGCCVSVL